MAIAFLNNVTFSAGAVIQKLRLENLGADPASGNEGQLYFNTATDKVRVYATGAWTDLDGANDFLTGLSFNTGDGVLTATIPNQSNVTVDLDGRYALSSSIPGTIVESVTAGTYLTNAGTAADVILNHDNTTRTNTSSVTSPAYGGTFTAVDSITTNATGHVSAVNLKTVTFPAAEDYTWSAAADAGGTRIIQSGNTIDFTGGTNINTENAGGETRFHLDDSITLAGTLTVNGTGQSSFGGQVTVPTTPSAGTDAASKSYVDSLVAGGLTFKDGFNAGTGAIDGGGNLTTGASRVAISVGDFYVVTTAGSFYGSVSLDVGDSVIAKEDAAQGASDINDWVIVQGDEGVTTFSNSNSGTYVAYGTTNSGAIGAVNIGDVDLTAVDGTSDTATRFLSKDNTWDVPSYTTNTDAKYALTAAAKSGSNVPLTLTGSDGGATTVVNLTEGSNITLTRNSSGQITIASTDTGALGDRVSLTGGSQAGGLTTFTYDVTNSFTGASAIDVKCEVISSAGETVYAGVTRSGANLSVEFVGSISDGAYEVLLTYVG